MAAKKTSQENSMHTIKRLYRSESDKMLGGVAGGLGEYLQLDATVIRLVFVLLAFFGGSGIFLYFIMWFIIPTKSSVTPNFSESFDEIKAKAGIFSSSVSQKSRTNNQYLISSVLIVLGLLLLSRSFNLFSVDFQRFIPLLLIVLGFFFIFRR